MEYQCPECKNSTFFIEKDDMTDSLSFRCADCGNEITHGAGLTIRQVVAIMDKTTQIDETTIDEKV